MNPDTPPHVPRHHGMLAGGRALFIAQTFKLAVRVGSAAVLARLLTPDAYGIFGMALAVHGVLYMLRDLGIGAAVLRPDLTPAEFNGLARMGLAGGSALAVACAILGWPAAAFYHDPRLVPMLAVMAPVFVFAGLGAAPLALLYREQRTGTAAAIDAVAALAGSLAAVAAAVVGGQEWALVTLALVTEAVAALAGWLYCPWKTRRTGPAPSWRKFLTFSARLSLHNVAGYLMRSMDQIILGAVRGPAALGIYGRGVQAVSLPMQFGLAPYTGWVIAGLSGLSGDPASFRVFFRQILNGFLHLLLPAAVVCLVVPEVVVGLLFGPKWSDAVPVVRLLALSLAVQPWLFCYVWVLIATGRTGRLLKVSFAITIMMTLACIVAARMGLPVLAAAVSGVTIIGAVISVAASTTGGNMGARDILSASLGPLALNSAGGLLLWAVNSCVAGWPLPSRCALLAAAGLLFGIVSLPLFPKLRAELKNHFLLTRLRAP